MPHKVVHLTSHHNVFDNRIFFRECCSLAAAGYDVTLVAQHDRDETRDGVRILGIPKYKSRLERVTRTAWMVCRRGLSQKASLYHLHDPELIIWGLILRLYGHRVIFDVHEDFVQAVSSRSWIPERLQLATKIFCKLLVHITQLTMYIVIAERYYSRSFPHACRVLNYPRIEGLTRHRDVRQKPAMSAVIRMIYTGSITPGRGAHVHVKLLNQIEDAELLLLGACEANLEKKLRAMAADGRRLLMDPASDWVSHEKILSAYMEYWTVGLALFPDHPHYREKELTKLFEYMAFGLPIVCSDFPVWRALVHETGCGICVPPTDIDAAAAAVNKIFSDPILYKRMGEAGRKAVMARFNWRTQEENLLVFYSEILRASALDRLSPARLADGRSSRPSRSKRAG